MRDALILLLFCFVCYPRMLAQQLAGIEGTVVNTTTGAPLSRVHLRLALHNPDEVVAPTYGALSDDAGRFSMVGIQPGVEYRLEADRQGFLPYPTVEQAPTGAIVRSFRPGEHVTGFRLEMAPRVILSGRVLDEHGEPIPGIVVAAQRVPQALPAHIPPTEFGLTDDRGQFRLAAVPERYYLHSLPQDERDAAPEIRTDGSIEGPYLSTYYPNSLTRESAGVVEARAGSDVSGIEIRPVRSAALSLSGTVSGIPEGAGEVEVLLRSVTRGGMVEQQNRRADASGRFSFARLEPGTYGVYAECCRESEPLRSQVAEVTLGNASRDFLPLELTRGFDLEGRITGAHGNRISLFAPQTEADFGQWLTVSAPVAGDGTFRIKGAQAGRYEAQVSGLPDGAYVASLRLGDREAADQLVDLRDGSAPLVVTVGAAGGEISGRLTDAHGATLDRLGFVYAVEDGRDFAPRHRHGEGTAADGSFTLGGLPPGKYRIFATVYGVSPFPPGADRIQVLHQWAAAADLVEIHEGEKLVRNLKAAGAK